MLASKSLQAPIRPAPIRAPGLSRGHSLLVTAAQRKPSFHLQPPGGWTNDPNGVHYDAKTKLYHMFYQHHPTSAVWSWGLSWGHAVSEDLVHWSHLPPALDPTPEGPDAGGVWSGCAFPTDEGTVLLHTAVRKRDETPESKLPPAELDLGHQVIESQQYAVSQPEKDPFLRNWEKGEKPLLPLPPQGGLTGWRDPFLVGRPGDGLHDKYTIIIGSGYMDDEKKEPSRGAVFVYTSDDPISGWKYEGELCHGDGSTGAVWECPLLARVENHPHYKGDAGPMQHILVVCPDNPHNTPVYFLGRYDPKTLKFDMENASGPHPVDLGGGPLGSTFYAPNVLNNDPHGRLIMWGWCQETGRPGEPEVYDYGSCLSVPRLIWRHPHKPGVIWQEPLPCLSQLRREAWLLSGGDSPSWTKITMEDSSNGTGAGSNGHSSNGQGNGALANGHGLETSDGNGTGANGNVPGSITPDSRVNLKAGQPLALPTELGSHPHLELELTLEPPTTLPPGVSAKTGIIIRSNEIVPMNLHEASGRNGAALLYDWRHARLEVVFSDGMEDLEALCAAPAVTYDIMNSTSRVYLTSHDAQAGEQTQPDSVVNMSTIKEGQEAEAPQCHIIHDQDTFAEGSTAPLHSAHGMSGRSGSAASDHDAEHQPLDVRGCHAVGGQLELWEGMDANTNGAPSTSNDDNSELAQASRSGMAASKAAVGGTLQPIKLRVFLDHSMLEAFTSTGQVLTTRVYHHEVEDHPLDLFERAAAAAKATSRPKSPAYQAREPTPEGTLASMQANNSPPADRQEKSPEPEVVTSTGPTEVVYADEAREKSPAAAQEESSPEPIPLAGRARSPSEASEGSPNNGAPDLPPSLELAAFGVDSGMSGVAGYKLAPIWQEDKITDDMEARARENFSKAGTRQQQQQQQQQQQVAA